MVTIDTNIAFYALQQDAKTTRAEAVLAQADFLSVQVLNEYAFAARRKLHREWDDIAIDIRLLEDWVQIIQPIETKSHHEALRLSNRYQLSFYDALLVAVALTNGAQTLYSEDMQHRLVIDDRLTIINPFQEAA